MKIPQYAMENLDGMKKWITTPECNFKTHYQEGVGEKELEQLRVIGHYGEIQPEIPANVFNSFSEFVKWTDSKDCPYEFRTKGKDDFELMLNLKDEGYFLPAGEFFVQNGALYSKEKHEKTPREELKELNAIPHGRMRQLFIRKFTPIKFAETA